MIALLTAVLASGAAAAADARVLVLGNSYIFQQDVDQLLDTLLEETVPAWTDVEVVALTGAGMRWADHLAQAQSPGSEWHDALGAGGQAWDFVVLQEQSQIPGFPQDGADWQASLGALVELDALVQAAGAQTVLMLTWGRRDGDSSNPDLYPDYATMQAALTAGTLAYADALATPERPVTVAPVGQAFQLVHDGYSPASDAFTGLYSADGSHPSAAGAFLAARVLASSISGRSTAGASPPASLDQQSADWLEHYAEISTVDDPFGVFPFAWAQRWAEWGGAPVVGEGGVRRTVGLVDPVETIEAIEVGADGRLWVEEEEALVVSELTVGEGGEALARTANLALERLVADEEQLALQHDGGFLTLGGGEPSTGSIVEIGGELLLVGLDLTGALTLQSQGVLRLDPDAPSTVHGTVTLGGDVVPRSACPDGAEIVVLLDADRIELEEVMFDPGLYVGAVDGRDAVLMPCDTDGLGPEPADPPATSTGCGCASGSDRTGRWLLALVVPLLSWRRRQASPSNSRRTFSQASAAAGGS